MHVNDLFPFADEVIDYLKEALAKAEQVKARAAEGTGFSSSNELVAFRHVVRTMHTDIENAEHAAWTLVDEADRL